ncbi:MAG: MG2 domain-containing protein [Haloarculaceae archaeon]
MDRRRAVRVAGVALVVGLLLWGGYAAYVFNLEDVQSNQRTVLLASGEVAPGAETTARVVVTDRASGDPLVGTNVTLFLGNGTDRRVIGRGETGSDGAMAVSFEAPNATGNHRLSARAASRLGTDEVSASFAVDRDYSVVVDTDKPVYQPGGTVHVRTLVRRAGGTPVTGDARVVVTGPEGNRLFSRNVSLSAFGMGSVDFPLSTEARHGRYRVTVEHAGEERVRTVEVREYRLPQFDVRFRPDESAYRPGETVRATVVSEYFFGEPVRNATVRVEGAGYVGDLEPFGTSVARTGADGVATVDLALPGYFVGTERYDGRGLAVLNVSVTDPAGHTETVTRRVPVTETDLLVEAVPAGGRLVPGVENTVFLTAAYPDGRPARATVRVGDRTLETNRYGIATYEFVPNGSNARLRVEARADGASTQRTVYLNADEAAVAVQLDAGAYEVGERLSGRVLVGETGGRVYVDAVSGGRTLATRSLEVRNGSATFSLDLPPAARGTTQVRAWVVRSDGSVARTTRPVPVRANRDLNVSLATNRSVYRPGEPASLTVRTTENGSAVPAAVGIDVVDESVFSVEARRAGLARAAFAFEAANDPALVVYNYSTANLTAPPSDDAERTAQAAVAASLGTTDSGVTVDSFRRKLQRIRERQAGMREANGYALGLLVAAIPLSVLGVGFARRGRSFGGELANAVGTTVVAGFLVGFGALTVGALAAMTGAPAVVGLVLVATLAVGGIYLAAERGWSPWGGRGLGRVAGAGVLALVALLGLAFLLADYLDVDALARLAPVLLPLAVLLPLVWVADAEEPFSREQLGRAVAALFAILVCVAPLGLFVVGFGATAGAGGADAGGESVAYQRATSTGGAGGAGQGATGPTESVEVRQFFPETLASRTVLTGADGRASVELRMADSITTWRVSALGATREGTVGSETGSMRVFQPFFVEPDLPTRLTRNDTVTVPVSVFNYGNATRNVTLELGSGAWYEADSRTATVTVPPKTVRSASFTLRANAHGERALTVFAAGRTSDGNVTRDAIRKSVTVDPPGKRLASTESGAVSGTTRVGMRVPRSAYPNTSETVLRVYPGAFGQTLGGVEALLSMPHGCFEQTSSSLYPNVLALRYLEETDRAAPETRLTAERFIAQGYQRLLTFETSTPGGYSLFGDDPPNLLLTAYGLQEMSDMDEVYDVDPAVLGEMRTFLRDRQQADGSWPTDGRLEYPLGVRGTDTGVTAYVTWSLAHSGASGPAVTDGVSYVRENLNVSGADTMTLAVTLNMLVDAGEDSAFRDRVVEELRSRARTDAGRVYWERSAAANGNETEEAYRYGDKRVLTTATVTNALVKGGHAAGLRSGALRWLVEQKGERGWGSTQNTVMTLRALVNARSGATTDVGGTLTVRANGTVAERVDLSGERGDEVQTFVLPARRGNNSYTVSAPDAEGLYYEFTTDYHVPWAGATGPERDGGVDLNVTWDRTNLTVDDTATVRARVTPGEGTIGMAIVDLPVPPGFEVEPGSLERLRERGAISRYEIAGRQAVLYLEDVEEPRTLEVAYRAIQPVEASTGGAEAYDYYNPDDRASDDPRTVTVNATADGGG